MASDNGSFDSQDWSHVGDEELIPPTESTGALDVAAPPVVANSNPTLRQPLTFVNFEDELRARGVLSSASSTDKTTRLQVAAKNQHALDMFKEDIESSLSHNGPLRFSVASPALPLLTGLRDMLPSRQDEASSKEGQGVVTEEDMAASNLFRTLLFSVSNGFAGLDDVPPESILTYIRRFGNTSSLLRQILKVPCHVTTAITENLFRAAIKGKDHEALSALLEISSIDVNRVVCFHNGTKYTALERAAKLHDCETVRVLLSSANADPNRHLAGGALRNLVAPSMSITGPQNSNISLQPIMMEIARLLVDAGAKVSAGEIFTFIVRGNLLDLGFFLLPHVPESQHGKLLTGGFLVELAKSYEPAKTVTAIKKFLSVCSKEGCNRCVRENLHIVTWILIYAAKRGLPAIIELFGDCSAEWERVLSAAIKGRDEETINLVLVRNPDLNAAPHDVDVHSSHNFHGASSNVKNTTSLAEALKAENWDLIESIEKSDTFVSIHQHGSYKAPPFQVQLDRMTAAIRAAAKMGNINYVRKLLGLCPPPEPFQLTDALTLAILNDHDDIFWLLIEAGAEVRKHFSGSPHVPDPLFAAVWMRKPAVVLAILGAGPSPDTGPSSSVYPPGGSRPSDGKRRSMDLLDAAIEWGDRSILLVLKRLFPFARIRPFSDSLMDVVTRDDEELLRFLFDHDMVELDAWSRCLTVAVEIENVNLVTRLVEFGADPGYSASFSSSGPLVEAAKCSSKMLEHLLPLIPRARLMDGLGTKAFEGGLKHLPASLPSLHVLLDSQAVNVSAGGFSRAFRDLIRIYKEPYDPEFRLMTKMLAAGCSANAIVDIQLGGGNQTAFMEAMATGNLALVRFMIDEDADIHQRAENNITRTPLQHAVELNNFNIFQLLLSLGADVNEKPAYRSGATALQLAAIKGNCKIAAELLSRGAQIDATPAKVYGRWPLEGAAENGRLEMIELLCRHELFRPSKAQCEKAMKLAEENGHLACRDRVEDILKAL